MKSAITSAILEVTSQAQKLGLVAPFSVVTWSEWWQLTETRSDLLATITLSEKLNSRRGRFDVVRKYGKDMGEITAEGLLAHEMGHAFQAHWNRNRSVKPLKGYRRAFSSCCRFEDPWNEMDEYLEEHPDEDLDPDKYLNKYAWSDGDEDFAETFAEVVCRRGHISSFRRRTGVYSKMQTILHAGRKILRADSVLRRCNRNGSSYLFGGQEKFRCPETDQQYGVPLVEAEYVCPCGMGVTYDGEYITHE